jgi:hypothetical protein
VLEQKSSDLLTWLARAAALFELGVDVDVFNNNTVQLRHDAKHSAGLAFIFAADNFDVITFLNFQLVLDHNRNSNWLLLLL